MKSITGIEKNFVRFLTEPFLFLTRIFESGETRASTKTEIIYDYIKTYVYFIFIVT